MGLGGASYCSIRVVVISVAYATIPGISTISAVTGATTDGPTTLSVVVGASTILAAAAAAAGGPTVLVVVVAIRAVSIGVAS